MRWLRRLLRRLRWVLRDGPKRLQAAQLRRGGELQKAMRLLFSPRGAACIVIECIKQIPDPDKRTRIYAQMTREASAGRKP